MDRIRVRPAVPQQCRHEGPDEVYDANGYGRWCAKCGEPLVEIARSGIWPLVLLVFILAGLTVCLMLAFNMHPDPGPRITPTTYPNPPVVHSIP